MQDAQVIGVPDERYGEELCAWVVPRTGATLDEDTIRAFCRERIAHYKGPRYVRIVSEFPTTGTGQVATSSGNRVPGAQSRTCAPSVA